MKFHSTLVILLLISIFPLHAKNILIKDTAISDTLPMSLMENTWFVIRGEMTPMWKGKIRFAVTDPIKNTGHDLLPTNGNKFEKTVPMHGNLQDIYLYIDGTITIPVCAGDTIDMTISDDDITLRSDNAAANRDLQLSLALHRKTRKLMHEINMLVNSYITAQRKGTVSNDKTDSIRTNAEIKFNEYRKRHKTVIDTFIINNGQPRLEKYFRMSGSFNPLHLLTLTDPPKLQYVTFCFDSCTEIPFNHYGDELLSYPSYRNFVRNYVNSTVFNTPDSIYPDITDKFIRASKIRHDIAPTPLLAEWLDLIELNWLFKSSAPEESGKYVKYVYESSTYPEIKERAARLMPDIVRLCQGQQAPNLTLRDSDGNRFTLDNFRGKYVYLDFWDFGCMPCLKEFAIMPKLKKHFADKISNVEFVTVCISRPSKRKFDEFVTAHGMEDLNMILDKKNSDPVYDISILPTYVMIDPEGKIVEFNTDRPSFILEKSATGNPSQFERAIKSN